MMRGVEFVCGQRGTGKTVYVRSRVLSTEPRFVIYDHMAEFVATPGAHVVHSAAEAIDYLKAHRDGIARVVITPLRASREEFGIVCRIPFAFRDLVFVCDEIDQWAGAVRPWPPEEFRRLIHFGRHFGCSFVGAARRPSDVARAFTSQAKRYTLFRITEPNDIRFLRTVLGEHAVRVRDLPDLHYLAYDGGEWKAGAVSVPGHSSAGKPLTPAAESETI